jgi:putative acetyltransferase
VSLLPESGGLHLRPAESGDAAAIRAVHEAAFPTRAEADLVARLERDGDVAVSLVATLEREIVGHLLLSRMRVTGDGRPRRALGLGPIGVLPPFQRGGIGSALIRGALEPYHSPYAGPYLMALAFAGAAPPASGTAEYARAFGELGASA